jgi:nitrate reductase delta subunit
MSTTPTFAVLGALLDYPDEALLEALPEIRGHLQDERLLTRDSRAGLARFLDHCEERDLITLQENYVAQFDRGRATSLYLFEHVHGESRDRGQAMVDLKQMYEQHGMYLDGKELPDYLPVFLEFLSRLPLAQAKSLLAETSDILVSIADQLAKKNHPYALVLTALLPLAGAPRATVGGELAPDDAQARPGQADYLALDAAYTDEPVRFVGAATPAAEQPMHFHRNRP